MIFLKKYEVIIAEKVERISKILIEANSKEEAEDKALEKYDEDPDEFHTFYGIDEIELDVSSYAKEIK